MTNHITSVCPAAYHQLHAANLIYVVCIVDGCRSDRDPGIRLQSAGLLQLGTQRHHREPLSTPAVGAERMQPG